MHLFLRTLTLAALILGAASALSDAEIADTHLEKRALPPCPKCPNNDGDWLSKFHPGNPGQPEDKSETYGKGWLPKAARTHGYVCYDLGVGVTYSSGGLAPPYGHWYREDGTQVICWRYWQSTLQFIGAGMTVNSYPAHCTVWIYTKGTGRVAIGGKEVLPQGSTTDACFGSAGNVDVGVISIYLEE